MFFSVAINVVCTLLTPLMANLHFAAIIAMRVGEGIGGGVTFPAMHVMLARWSPPTERSVMSSIVYAGTALGTVVCAFQRYDVVRITVFALFAQLRHQVATPLPPNKSFSDQHAASRCHSEFHGVGNGVLHTRWFKRHLVGRMGLPDGRYTGKTKANYPKRARIYHGIVEIRDE